MQDWFSQQDHLLQALLETHQASAQSAEENAPCVTRKREGPQDIQMMMDSLSMSRSRSMISDKSANWQNSTPKLMKSVSSVTDVLSEVRDPVEVKENAVSTLARRNMPKLFTRPSLRLTSELEDEKPSPPRLVQCVRSQWFEALCSLCIVINAAFIAYTADYAAKNLGKQPRAELLWAERGFAAFYIAELALRLMVYRISFFRTDDWLWNIFDTALVVNAIYDQVMDLANVQQGAAGNVVFLRVVRLMKMLKLLRMVRIMRSFKELRLIVVSITGSTKSLFWAVMLIIMITYMVGICFLQAGTAYLQESGATISKEKAAAIRQNWGSLSQAMLSLYMASTNGHGWRDMAEALIPVGYPFYVLFLLYIAFFMFVVMNTLTSLFIEATMQNAEKDQSTVIRHELQRTSDYIKRAVTLFQKMDADLSGDISEEEFRKHATCPEMMAFASSLELDVIDIAQFYNMLSSRGKYAVDLETFVVGCVKLKGNARSLDLQGLIANQKRDACTLEGLATSCQQILQLVQESMPRQNGGLLASGSNKSLGCLQSKRWQSNGLAASGRADNLGCFQPTGPDHDVTYI